MLQFVRYFIFCFKDSTTCNLEELDDDIEQAKNDLGASFICSASYDIIPKEHEGCKELEGT